MFNKKASHKECVNPSSAAKQTLSYLLAEVKTPCLTLFSLPIASRFSFTSLTSFSQLQALSSMMPSRQFARVKALLQQMFSNTWFSAFRD
jgi:hypothetical protein